MFRDLKNHQKTMHRINQVHFVGIGGVGMAGIAEVLLSEGYHVTGSDCAATEVTARLSQLGATVYGFHDPAHVDQADVVVRSSAVGFDNPEITQALSRRIPVIARAEMLAELMRFRYGIAVAGTHGKTTTTSMLATIFSENDKDPTFVIGGRLNSHGTHAKLGIGRYLIAEADESDASFLHLLPVMSVITNINEDHLQTYHGDFEKLKQTFVDFIHRLPFYGLAIVGIDNEQVRALLPQMNRPILTVGFSEEADIRAVSLMRKGCQQQFIVCDDKQNLSFPVTLNMPGRHNVLNALAAIAVALEQGISPAGIARALLQFEGVDRRFTVYQNTFLNHQRVTLVDDYGHHPEELKATLLAARETWPLNRLVWVFQPHRYTRTRDCFEALCEVLTGADVLILLDVYSAGETRISGADEVALFSAIGGSDHPHYFQVSSPQAAKRLLDNVAQTGDIILIQGAGSIKQLVDQCVTSLELADV